MVETEEEVGDDFVFAKLLIPVNGFSLTMCSVHRCNVRMEGKVGYFWFRRSVLSCCCLVKCVNG